jgi:hypothetical protein
VWEITSRGYLYVRDDPKVPFDQAPNRVLHRLTVTTEIQRLAIRPPARGALLVEEAGHVELGAGARIRGGSGAAVVSRKGSGKSVVHPKAVVSAENGTPLTSAPTGRGLPPYDLSELAVFGVRPGELKDLADVVVGDSGELPLELPQMAIVVVDGDARFDEEQPLVGGGILYVNGDLEIAPNSNSSFFGLLYVAGDLSVGAPAALWGATIVRGHASIQGTRDISEVGFNEDVLGVVRRNLGQYRIRRAPTRVYSAGQS